MARPQKLPDGSVDAWLVAHPRWDRTPDSALERTIEFPDYAAAIAFVVRLAMAAEAKDHHPDLEISWRRVRVRWSTHDAAGITALDLEMAELTNAFGP